MSFGTSNNVSAGAWYTVDCSASYGYMCKRPAGIQCPADPHVVTVTPVPSNPSYCNSALLMAPGTITSPNYPGYYDNNGYCTYQLATLGAYNILLKFNNFVTEPTYDYVTVRDGDSSTSHLFGNYSGSLAPFNLVSTGNTLLVTFRSDRTNTYKGFSASFSAYSYHS